MKIEPEVKTGENLATLSDEGSEDENTPSKNNKSPYLEGQKASH